MSKKLAYITSAYGRASDTFIRNEIHELRRLGYFVSTFSVRRPESVHEVDEDVTSERANTTYILAAGVAKLFAATIVEFLRNPIRFCKALRLVHQLTGDGLKNRLREVAYFGEAAFLASRLRQKRIEHIHDHIGENSAVVAAVAAQLAKISFSLTIHGSNIFYAADQFRLARKIHRSKFCICISHYARSQCMMFTPTSDWPKLRIVRCCISPFFITTESTRVADVPHFVTVGRLSSEKGQLLLIDAFASLADQNFRASLTIIGDGPLRSTLQSRIDSLNLQEQVKISGWTSSAEIMKQLQLARAFILTSFAEGLPVVLMEALALERPVISTCIAGIPELVRPGENGWLVPAGDVQALADAMREALETPVERLIEMGKSGRKSVIERHDIRKEVAKLASLFQDTPLP